MLQDDGGAARLADRRNLFGKKSSRYDDALDNLRLTRPYGCQQAVHGREGRPHRFERVFVEFGVILVEFRVGRDHRELADHVFHIVNDESKALAIGAQLIGFDQSLCVLLLRDMDRGLAADDPQQVENLAI